MTATIMGNGPPLKGDGRASALVPGDARCPLFLVDDYADACRAAQEQAATWDLDLFRSPDAVVPQLSGIAEWIPAATPSTATVDSLNGIFRSVYEPPTLLIATRKPYRDMKPLKLIFEDLAVASDADREQREYGPGSRAGALRHEIGAEFEYLGRSRSDATTAKWRRAYDPWEAPDPRVDWIDRVPSPSRYPFQSSRWARLRAQREVERRADALFDQTLVERDGDLFWGGVRLTSDPSVPDGRAYGLVSGAAMRAYRDAETEISERTSDVVDALRYAMAAMLTAQQTPSVAFVSPEIAARLGAYTEED